MSRRGGARGCNYGRGCRQVAEQNIETRIDWEAFYRQHVERLRPSGENHFEARCPFHGDTHPSFSIHRTTGQYKCNGCNETGNGWTFAVKRLGYSDEAARTMFRRLAGMEERKAAQAERKKYTVADYAAEKKLDPDMLNELKMSNGRGTVRIPYIDADGTVKAIRRRKPAGLGSRFAWDIQKGGGMIPYGVWNIDTMRAAGMPLILVEGESDAMTLWQRGHMSVIGVPGSKSWQDSWSHYVDGFDTVLIHDERDKPDPDKPDSLPGSEWFKQTIAAALRKHGYKGVVKVFSTHGYKDPSDLHLATFDDNPPDFDQVWQASLDAAQVLDLQSVVIDTKGNLTDAPVTLVHPEGYRINEHGVKRIDDKGMEISISPLPLLISKRLRSIDTSEEKIELVYRRDNQWHRISGKRSSVFTNAGIIEVLADHGFTVSSDNAREIVKYLARLEASNLDAINVERSVERLGWVGTGKFLPGHAGDVVLEIPPGSEATAAAYHTHGKLDAWIEVARRVSAEHDMARFMLAASFAAPLLNIVRERVFIVHAWGASRGGKTAAVKLALSPWGSPDDLIATFNATRVGMERMAAFFCDLPLGIDERQVIGKDQNLAEGLVYLLGAGRGKIRGAKGGGLQTTHTWRTIALTTGEEPLSRSASHTGVKTRALEVFGEPISDETLAREIHRTVGDNYGEAGPHYIKALIAYQAAGGNVAADFEKVQAEVERRAVDRMSSHVAAAALCALADQYAHRFVYGVESADSVELAMRILDRVEGQSEADYGARANDWLSSWLASNSDKLKAIEGREQWGEIETHEGEGVVWILPYVLDSACAEQGLSSRRLLQELKRTNQLAMSDESDGRLTKRRTFRGMRTRMIGLRGELSSLVVPEAGIPGAATDRIPGVAASLGPS